MTTGYLVVSIFIAWIWVDYFRLIDVFDRERMRYLILVFLVGAVCAGALAVTLQFTGWTFPNDGGWVDQALYCLLGIGLPEEAVKTIPYLVACRWMRRQVNEPVDHLVFISVGSLGFAAAENVLYFQRYGAAIIDGRSILSTVTHMFSASIVAYGVIRAKFILHKPVAMDLGKYLLLASVSHAFYDFWLIYEGVRPAGWIISLLYFMMTISVFATILNNALNHSSFFTYKKVVNPDRVAGRLIVYYLGVFLLQFILFSAQAGIVPALKGVRSSVWMSGFVIAVSVVRLSRFRLIRGHWQPVRLEMPFEFSFPYRIRVKGDGFNEAHVSAFFEENCLIVPLSRSNPWLKRPRRVFMEKKIFSLEGEAFYLTRVYLDSGEPGFRMVLLKPKTRRIVLSGGKHPIVGFVNIRNPGNLENGRFSGKDCPIAEWAIIRPLPAAEMQKDASMEGLQ